ncbi:hypothetical protein [Streptomyces sp. NBC_01497]|uniref:hypothetical protein n=1 Tax=Streptomyces sp. NBC_01497 TaxID=2903885 RepID=UPI002E3727CB|nr:hypothetical protein [Streptomyces sp. NBC_01497]
MASHAFQCLLTDRDLRASLVAIHAALRPGAHFAFETRHPQARAWENWTPSNATDITDTYGRALRVWHEIDSVTDDVVTFTETTAAPDGAVLRVDRTSLRFYDVTTLVALLVETGFEVETRFGDWNRGPVTGTSQEIITIARRT